MTNTSQSKARRCCSTEYERVVRDVGNCEMESASAAEKHACYRRVARASGRRARSCIAGV